MRKEYLSIIKALSTVFFQEGFDREEKKHGLEYWCDKRCKICGNAEVNYYLDTVDINGQWFLRVLCVFYDEYGKIENLNVDLLISVNTERLCWEEMPKCANLIAMKLFPDLDT